MKWFVTRNHQSEAPANGRRRGVVTLELIFWLPILVIFTLALIEFALILQMNRQVAYASRYGAKQAAEITRAIASSPNLSNFNQSATLNNLQSQIDTLLANYGLTASCEVQLLHNACVQNPSQTDTAVACNCGASAPSLAGGEPPAGEAYVKVTVCVPLTGNVPNCLQTFGFDITGCTIEHSTVLRIETSNTAPTSIITTNSATSGTPAPALPASTPPNPIITITHANADAATTVDVNFDGNSSSDVDNPFSTLSFLWTTTGTALGSTTSPTFDSRFAIPGLPGDAVGGSTDFMVTLAVTDTCNATTTTPVTIRVVRLP